MRTSSVTRASAAVRAFRWLARAGLAVAAALVIAATLSAGSCGGGSGNAAGAARAACYPKCLADLVKRCPLTSACLANLEPDPSVKLPGESSGVAACFASGEKQRLATDVAFFSVVYVKAPDGSECYAAVGDNSPGIETWNLSVGGRLFGSLTWDLGSGAVAVSCDGETTQVDITQPLCAGLPWDNKIACETGTNCSFGSIPAPGAWDAGAPPGSDCDAAACDSPPPAKCNHDSTLDRSSLTTYATAGTCDGFGGCTYAASTMACPYACYEAQCIGPLTSIGSVAGTFVYNGTKQTVSLTGGSAPASGPVTVTARTLPRGAARSVDLRYRWRSATQTSITMTLFMGLDPNTPAGQSDYDQWIVDIPAQTAGTQTLFSLEATGYGGPFIISQAGTGTEWTYTSQ